MFLKKKDHNDSNIVYNYFIKNSYRQIYEISH